jgi:hypothetical protein
VGFPARRVYSLNFSEFPDLDGLVIKTRSATVGALRSFLEVADREEVEVEDQIAEFVASVIEWNLEDEDGQPVERTVEAVRAHVDRHYLLVILRAWVDTVVGVPAPLERRSPDGEQSPVELPPMEPLSESQAS